MNLHEIRDHVARMGVRLSRGLAGGLHRLRQLVEREATRTEAPERTPGGPPPRTGDENHAVGSHPRSAGGALTLADRPDVPAETLIDRFWQLRNLLKSPTQATILSLADLYELARLSDRLSLDMDMPAETQFTAIFTLGQVKAELGRRAQEAWRQTEHNR